MNSRYSSKEWKMLERIQNARPETDILTITALMDNQQFMNHFKMVKESYRQHRITELVTKNPCKYSILEATKIVEDEGFQSSLDLKAFGF